MKRLGLLLSLIGLVIWTGGAQPPSSAVAITGAFVVDGTGAPAYPATVVIEGNRIRAVNRDGSVPPGATVVNATGATVIPGLFDLHTHLTASGASMGASADWPKNLLAYLYSGVTTVVDLGEYQENFEGIRQLLAAGTIEGPRIALATRFSSPGGHGAESGRPDIHTREVLTPREAHAAMAEVLRGPKPDLIKIFTDGWRYGSGTDMTSMDGATIAAIVEDAHQAGIPVITHTVTRDRAKVAAKAGVDILGHSVHDVEFDAELTALVKSKGTYYVPTLAVYEPKAGRDLTPLLADVVDPNLGERTPEPARTAAQQKGFDLLLKNVALAKAAGIPVASGTDAGMGLTYHGWATLRELKLLTQAGLTPLEALTAATGTSAKALRVAGERGFIEAGKLADLVIVDGRPDQQIGDVEKIRSVYFGGKLVNREGLKAKILSKEISALPAAKAPAELDDFERANGRAANGAVWINYSDAGHDRSRVLWTRSLRSATNHALLIEGRMGQKDRPWVELQLPFAAGGLLPVDASQFHGFTFEARGDGAYRLIVQTRGVRDSGWFAAPFQAGPEWSTVKVDFNTLARPAGRPPLPWTGKDLLGVGIEVSKKAGETGWVEVDNLALY